MLWAILKCTSLLHLGIKKVTASSISLIEQMSLKPNKQKQKQYHQQKQQQNVAPSGCYSGVAS